MTGVNDEGSIWCGAGTLSAVGAALVLAAALVLRVGTPGKYYWLTGLKVVALCLLVCLLVPRIAEKLLVSRIAEKLHVSRIAEKLRVFRGLAPWLLVILGPILAATVTGFWILRSSRTAATVVLLVGGTLSWVVARQWSRWSLRIFVAVTVATVLILVGRVGQESLDSERLARARSHAEEANAELVMLSSGADAHRSSDSLDTKVRSASARVDSLCRAGGGHPGGSLSELMRCTPVGRGETPRELDIVDAKAKREVAAIAALVSNDDASKARLTRADSDLSSALSDRQNLAKPQALTSVLSAGGNSLARAVPGLGDPRVPVALTVVGWILVAALALAAYRRLERANSKRGLGLVKIVGLAGGNDKEDLQGEFRRYLIANVAEPGAMPGAQALTTAADLLEAAPDPASKIIQSILKVIPAITAPQASYVVDVTYGAPDAPPPDPPAAAGAEAAPTDPLVAPGSARSAEPTPKHEVFVRITSAIDQSTVATHSACESTSHLAVRAAGYWAAAWILERDRTSPSWAAWSAESAPALAAYDETGDGDDTVGLHHLENCANLAPTSGLVLTRLAQAYDLKNRHVDALELYLRAVTRHPRYPIACYRVGLSLSLIAARVQTDWLVMSTEGRDIRCRVLESMDRCGQRMNLDEEKLRETTNVLKNDATTPDGARTALCKAALLFLGGTTSLLNRRQVATNALRRSERRYWLPHLRGFRQGKARSGLWDIANSAKLSVTYRGGLTKDKVGGTYAGDLLSYTSRAEEPKTSWQVVYNLACHKAIVAADPPSASSRHAAITLLEQVLERDGSGQLKQAWLDGDPDLESLRGVGRFIAFRDKLNKRPEVGEDEDS